MIGFDYEITYKSGKENRATDALSRREDFYLVNATFNALITVDSTWLPRVQQSWQSDPSLQQLMADLVQDTTSHPGFSWAQGVLTYKGSLVVGNSTDLRTQIITAYHNSAEGGHSGIEKTARRIKRTFF